MGDILMIILPVKHDDRGLLSFCKMELRNYPHILRGTKTNQKSCLIVQVVLQLFAVGSRSHRLLLHSLKLTFSHLKIDGWNTKFPFETPAYFQVRKCYISGRVLRVFCCHHCPIIRPYKAHPDVWWGPCFFLSNPKMPIQQCLSSHPSFPPFAHLDDLSDMLWWPQDCAWKRHRQVRWVPVVSTKKHPQRTWGLTSETDTFEMNLNFETNCVSFHIIICLCLSLGTKDIIRKSLNSLNISGLSKNQPFLMAQQISWFPIWPLRGSFRWWTREQQDLCWQ